MIHTNRLRSTRAKCADYYIERADRFSKIISIKTHALQQSLHNISINTMLKSQSNNSLQISLQGFWRKLSKTERWSLNLNFDRFY
jgi:hypothetical protein